MSPECEAGQRQVHIVTPIPLPYIAPSTAVLQSMMRKELKDKKAHSPDIPLLEDLDNDPVGSVQVPTADAQQASKNADPEPPRITHLGNPIEPLLLALLSPNTAEQDNTFVPPSPNCRCKADCIQWSCIHEYTKNVSVNAWGY
ncbi:hypothetical protein F5887DRAFT_1076706 [Amanita rubescens]|nr:hypothetical protein F5887DRAFT_1076706 [Amanita rubescens]